LIDKVKLVV
jgi:hypothetical protein